MEIKSKIEKFKKFARDERTIKVLETVAKLGTIMFIGLTMPNASGHLIKLLGWAPNHRNKYGTKRTMESLKKRKFIKIWFKDNRGKITLTPEGRAYMAGLKVKNIKLPLNKRWDGLWRIVTFDIPEKLKVNRRRFARALDFAGMYNFEKSVFVYPHECKEQIFEIANLYEVKKYVRYIVANSVEPDFGLKINFPYTKLYKNVSS